MHGREIEINRNVIERFLMKVRDFIRKNKKQVIIALVSVLVASAIVIAGIVIYQLKDKSDLAKFESAINKYNELNIEDRTEKIAELKKTVETLNSIIDSSYWGYVNENGYYIIADLYVSMDMQAEAKQYLIKFIAESPDSFFAPLALQRAGIITEKLGKQDEALAIYQRLENDYSDSIIADEIYYNLGRIYQEKGELMKAREYFNKIVSLYPRSVLSDRAKKRLLLLGYFKNKEN